MPRGGNVTTEEFHRIASLMIFGDETGKALPAQQAYQRVRPCSEINAREQMRRFRQESAEFQKAYEEELARFRKLVLSTPLATKEGQIQELLSDLDRLEFIRQERAREYAEKTPGGSTGLFMWSGSYYIDRAWMDAKTRILERILELSGNAPNKNAPPTNQSFAQVTLMLPSNGSENTAFVGETVTVEAKIAETPVDLEALPSDGEDIDW